MRTPLNAIIGFGQLLVTDTYSATPEQRREFTGHIVRAGSHLLTLIDEVLNLAQIESGKLSVSVESVQLDDLLQDCQTMMEPLGSKRGVSLRFPTDCEFSVEADRVRLKQVLLNLLSNAVKYNRERGSVEVSCTLAGEGRVRISVEDSGIGLRPDQLKSLFQPFNRLGREASGVEGTGIGLVVTKRLVDLMGGTIGVSSSVDKGSTFWLELVASRPSALPTTVPLLAPGPASPSGSVDRAISTVLC
ncbi:MAG: HAMP domain-containing sensor histidine kinase, partial [Burkholderiales bacterium]